MYIHTYTPAYKMKCGYNCLCVHPTCLHTRPYHSSIQPFVYTCTQLYAHTHIYVYKHTYANIHIYTYKHIHILLRYIETHIHMYVFTHAEDMNLYYMHVSMHMYIQVCVPLPCTPEVCLMRTWLGAGRVLQSRATQSTDGRAQQLQEQRVRE